MLYTRNLYNIVRQLYLKKIKKENETGSTFHSPLASLTMETNC